MGKVSYFCKTKQVIMKKAIYQMAVSTLLLASACTNGEQADFNRDWKFWSDTQTTPQVINLPHDAMQTETRSADVKEGRHTTDLSVKEISERLGYCDQLYFSAAFRKRAGYPPTVYRRKQSGLPWE